MQTLYYLYGERLEWKIIPSLRVLNKIHCSAVLPMTLRVI